MSFRATRRSDKKVVWEKEIGKAWKTPKNVYAGCGLGMQCMFDKMHGDWNQWMGAVLAEARADLVATIASLRKAGPGEAPGRNRQASLPRNPWSRRSTRSSRGSESREEIR